MLDLNHGLQFTPMARITGSDELAVCADADVVVITAGAKQQPGQTRLDLAAANVAMCRELVPTLVELAPDALVLVVTNPVDVVTYAALEFSGLPSQRVFGSGTVLDSSRLRLPDRGAHRRGGAERPRLHRRRARRLRDAAVVEATIGGCPSMTGAQRPSGPST